MVLLAKLVRWWVPPLTRSSVSSASLTFRISAKISWHRSSGSISDSHGDVAEAGRRSAMARAHRLRGLAFAAVGCAPQNPLAGAADGVAGVPELSGNPAVAGIFEHPDFLAVANFPAHLAAELEVVAPIINGPTAVGLQVEAVVGIRNQ